MEAAVANRMPRFRGQAWLIGALLVLAFLAWVATDDRMGGMDAGPGTDPGSLGFYVVTWVVMMAAMMFPSIAPMVLTYRRVQEGRERLGRTVLAGTTPLFVAGYLVAWTAFGLAAYALVEGIRSLDIGFLAWDEAGREVVAGVLVVAALYQFTPAKDVCLTHCRSPLDFLMEHWHDGRAGALRMGIVHGSWCVGCCWALMAALIALGVMSLGWMAFISAIIAAEKLMPSKALATRTAATLLAALGIAIAISPGDVPGLTVPGSAEAQRAMDAMGMGGKDRMPARGAGAMGNRDDAMGDQKGAMGDGKDAMPKQDEGMGDRMP
jgi:predicted metal-binding membrane protein